MGIETWVLIFPANFQVGFLSTRFNGTDQWCYLGETLQPRYLNMNFGVRFAFDKGQAGITYGGGGGEGLFERVTVKKKCYEQNLEAGIDWNRFCIFCQSSTLILNWGIEMTS